MKKKLESLFYHMSKANKFVFSQDVEGWLWKEEGKILFELAQKNKDLGAIVELGSYQGKSAIYLSQGSKIIGGGKIFAIDNFIGDKYMGVRKSSYYDKFISNIKKYSLEDFVEPIKGDFSEIAKGWNKPIRLLFIDGAHGYEDAKRDFENWEPKVAERGIIVFHDALTWPGVSKFILDIIKSNKFIGFKTLKTFTGITYLTKPKYGEKISEADNKKSLEEFEQLLKTKNIQRGLTGIREKIFVRK